jgi:hypothetical protein
MRGVGVLLLVVVTAVCCVQFPLRPHKEAPESKAPAATPRTPPPVTPDQVNEANARAKAALLQEELDRAAEEPAAAPEKPAVSK